MRLKMLEGLLPGAPVSDIQRILDYHSSFFGAPFSAFVQTVLRGPSFWSVGERELFATFASSKNQCVFRTGAHGAVASLALNKDIVEAVLQDWHTAPVSEPVRATLGLLEKLMLAPAKLGPEDVKPLLALGLSAEAIEDALAIGTLFSIINRLADSFEVAIPSSEGFRLAGAQLLAAGYV
jgi:uncharacterized peroxidase-related enzyme